MKNYWAFSLRASRRLSGFAVNVLLLAAASLVLMPATIGAAGLETWSSIVLGQALGLIVQTVAGLGYGVNGPAIVATQSLDDGVSYFCLAQRARLVVAVPCFASMAIAMFLIPNPDPVVGILGGAHLAIGSFTAQFFYVGRAAPLWQLVAETAPRATLMLAGALSLYMGAPLVFGLSLPALGAVLAVVTSTASIVRSAGTQNARRRSSGFSEVRAELWGRRGPIAASALRGGRDALPVLLVTAVATAELVGTFGVFERIQRQIVGALIPVVSTLQGWVPRRIAIEKTARPAVTALLASCAGAPVIVLLFAWVGPPLVWWLSAKKVTPTLAEISLCGSFIATSLLIQVIAYACLVPLGGIRDVVKSDIAGVLCVLVGVPVVSILQPSVASVLGALVAGNVIQILMQIILMRRSIVRQAYLVPIQSVKDQELEAR